MPLAPQTPEAIGYSSPAELIVQMLQYGLHIEPWATPASESLKGSPMGFPISVPSSSPSHLYSYIGLASVSFSESQPVFQLNLGLLLAGGPTSWTSLSLDQHCSSLHPALSLTAESNQDMSASFLGYRGGNSSR